MARNYMQGRYNPERPDKYIGDPRNIVYRSSWERRAFLFADRTPAIIKWGSEEKIIKYWDPTTEKERRYFTDLQIWVQQPDGSTKKFIIEIKPYDQTHPPRKTAKKSDKTYLEEMRTWAVNDAKWKAAREWCRRNGFEFLIWTEKDLYPNMGKVVAKKRTS